MNRNYHLLPKMVHDWLWLHQAWIVGSGVDWYLSESKYMPKDLDIIIPPPAWNQACKLIPSSEVMKTNMFGGFKCVFDDISVDFWPEHLENLFTKALNTTNKNVVRALRLNPHTFVTASR